MFWCSECMSMTQVRSPDQECWTVAQWLVPVNIRLPRHEPSSVVISAYRRQHTRHETYTEWTKYWENNSSCFSVLPLQWDMICSNLAIWSRVMLILVNVNHENSTLTFNVSDIFIQGVTEFNWPSNLQFLIDCFQIYTQHG